MRNDMFCLKGYSAYDTCPKAELQDIPDSWISTMTLGNYVTGNGYTYSKKGNVFVCADVYDRMHMQTGHRKLNSAVLICYIVSLLSLLATFVIYARHPGLRTKPGLMLLNLVVALFLHNFFRYWIHLHSLKARWQCVKFWRQPNITSGLPLLPGWSVYRWTFSDASPRLLHLPYHMWVSWTNFM